MYRTDKLIKNGDRAASIGYNVNVNEYRVRLWEGDKPVVEADYFTDDKDDAIGTAHHMVGLRH